jgi:hypothetical protein
VQALFLAGGTPRSRAWQVMPGTTLCPRGTVKVIEDATWLGARLNALTAHNEGQPAAAEPSDAPTDYLEKMMSAIIGVGSPSAPTCPDGIQAEPKEPARALLRPTRICAPVVGRLWPWQRWSGETNARLVEDSQWGRQLMKETVTRSWLAR